LVFYENDTNTLCFLVITFHKPVQLRRRSAVNKKYNTQTFFTFIKTYHYMEKGGGARFSGRKRRQNIAGTIPNYGGFCRLLVQ
jgi:hypothetical protein